MPSSPEVKPPSDAAEAEPDSAADVQRGSDIWPQVSLDEEGSGQDEEIDLTDPDAWPDAPPVRKRSIDAGPDLEIVTDAGGDSDTATKIEDVADARYTDAAASEAALFDQEASDRQSRGPEQVAAVVATFLGRVDQDAIDQHRAEYLEPTVWMWRRLVGAAFAFILVSFTWYLIKLPSGLIGDARVPTLGQVAGAFHQLRTEGFAGATLSGHVGISLFRLAVGLGVGAFLGVSVGLVAGASPLVRTILDPITSFFRTVPGLAAGPLLVLWFGVGEAGLLSVVVFSVMWAAVAATADGRTEGLRTGSLDVLGVVFAGARSALLLAWATVLAIETVMAPTGLGSMIWFAQGRSDLMVAGILVAGVTGFALDILLRVAHYLIVNNEVMTYAPMGPRSAVGRSQGLAHHRDNDRTWQAGVADPLDITSPEPSQPLT